MALAQQVGVAGAFFLMVAIVTLMKRMWVPGWLWELEKARGDEWKRKAEELQYTLDDLQKVTSDSVGVTRKVIERTREHHAS